MPSIKSPLISEHEETQSTTQEATAIKAAFSLLTRRKGYDSQIIEADPENGRDKRRLTTGHDRPNALVHGGHSI
jgi:hypothetical protein